MSGKALICTTYNEEYTIRDLLLSIENQSRTPDEFVVVDAGSEDRTVDIIQNWRGEADIDVNIYTMDGCNIPRGRNFAIEQTDAEIIAVTDAGVTLDEQWFENITTPLDDSKADVVSGYYVPQTDSFFQKISSRFSYIPADNIDADQFLPSSRSIAFRKSSWQEVGGYPEKVDIGEDTLFDIKLRKDGNEFVFQKSAVVYWEHSVDLKDFVCRTTRYAFWDGYLNIPQERYRVISRVFAGTAISVYSIVNKKLKPFMILFLGILIIGGRDYKIVSSLEEKRYHSVLVEVAYSIVLRVIYEAVTTIGYICGVAKRFMERVEQ